MKERLPTREERRALLILYIRSLGKRRDEGIKAVADLLYISPDTIDSWTKPATSRSSREVPMMALELLMLKVPLCIFPMQREAAFQDKPVEPPPLRVGAAVIRRRAHGAV